MLNFIQRIWRGRRLTNYNQSFWTTQDGRVLKLVDMTDDHLRNCIFYLHRQTMKLAMQDYSVNSQLYSVCPEYSMEYKPLSRPSALSLDPGHRFPIYYDMLKEADRRNIKWSTR